MSTEPTTDPTSKHRTGAGTHIAPTREPGDTRPFRGLFCPVCDGDLIGGMRGLRDHLTDLHPDHPATLNDHVLARRREFVEDVAWMASTGETTLGAARRMNLKPQTIRAGLDRARRLDLWDLLQANQNRHRTSRAARATGATEPSGFGESEQAA